MAEVLQDYLVNIRYATDAASQSRFLDQLKKVATSVAGIAGEITALGVAILGMAKSMASTGEQLYFSSQRMGSSIANIKSASFALTQFGISADAANASVERFSDWTRNMGPAATAFLQRLGVTATNTRMQMAQLGETFQRMGGTYAGAQRGDMRYAMARRYAAMMGIDEQTMLAMSDPSYAAQSRKAFSIQRMIWGGDPDQASQQFGRQSNQVMSQFRQMGLVFETLKQKFASGLFQVILPHLERLNAELIQMLPSIERLMQHVISYVPAVMTFLDRAVQGLGMFAHLVSAGVDMIERMPVAFKHMGEAIIGMKVLTQLATSPIGLLITALTTLLILIEDYQGWKSGRQAAFDWSGFEKLKDQFQDIVAPIADIKKSIDEWIQKIFGVKDATDYIIGAAALLAWGGLINKIGGVSGAVQGLIGLLSGPAGLVALLAAATVGGLYLTGKEEQAGRQAIQKGFGSRYKLIPGDPSIGQPDMYLDTQTNKTIEPAELLRQLGHSAGFVTAPELMSGQPNQQNVGPPHSEQYGPPAPPGSEAPKRHWWQMGEADTGVGTSFQLASAGTDFPVPAGFGGGAGGGGEFGTFLAQHFGGGGGYGSDANTPEAGAKEGAAELRDTIAAKLGITREQASGIVSNMQAESGLRPDIQYGGKAIDPSSGRAIGLVQWAGSRRTRLLNWAKERGLDVRLASTQIEYMKWELDKYFPQWRKVLSGAGNDPQAIANAWYTFYESGGAAELEQYRGQHVAPARSIMAAQPGGGAPLLASASAPGGGVGGKGQQVANNTTINVSTSDPTTAANKVAYEQKRIHEQQTRRAAPMRSR